MPHQWMRIGRELMALVNGTHSLLLLMGPTGDGFAFSWWCDGKLVAFYLPLEALYLEPDDLVREHLNMVAAMRLHGSYVPYERVSEGKLVATRYVEDEIIAALASELH